MASRNSPDGKDAMSNEAICRMAKEIVVKFIEVGKVSPAGFARTFEEVYQSIARTVRS